MNELALDESLFDRYLSPRIRSWIEKHYYERINRLGLLEEAIQDPAWWSDRRHPSWFSDHGVVHVRDVAYQVMRVLDTVHGVLIPERPPRRLDPFMKGYGVILAYLHDIGMVDFSAFGRAIHPEYASQAVFSPEFDWLLEEIWSENYGNIAWRLIGLDREGSLTQSPELVLRELLALCACHSKSKVPASLLSDPQGLHARMQAILGLDLQTLYARHRAGEMDSEKPHRFNRQEALSGYYQDFESQSYCWLLSGHPEVRQLLQDATDTLRALRCADALRQRGTVQKTSGGYEVFISRQSAEAVYALRSEDGKLFLLEMQEAISAGEANTASSELTRAGDLRISFQRGVFDSREAMQRAAQSAASIVNDIQKDVIESFVRPASLAAPRRSEDIRILLEAADDNPEFVDLVIESFNRLALQAAPRIQKVPSLQNIPLSEQNRYLEAAELDWDDGQKVALLEKMARSGQKTQGMDMQEAFQHVRLASLKPGEVLMEAGTPPGFVYLPLGAGLVVTPLGGYQPVQAKAWVPMGNTSVIRGAMRNSNVIADREMQVLIIPKEIYLQHWYHPYTIEELRQVLSGESYEKGIRE